MRTLICQIAALLCLVGFAATFGLRWAVLALGVSLAVLGFAFADERGDR